jgi:hypothetical protein
MVLLVLLNSHKFTPVNRKTFNKLSFSDWMPVTSINSWLIPWTSALFLPPEIGRQFRRVSHQLQRFVPCWKDTIMVLIQFVPSIRYSVYCAFGSVYCAFGMACTVHLVWPVLCIWYSLYCAFGTACTVYLVRHVLCIWYRVYCAFGMACTMHLLQRVLCIWYSMYCAFSTVCTVHYYNLHVTVNSVLSGCNFSTWITAWRIHFGITTSSSATRSKC